MGALRSTPAQRQKVGGTEIPRHRHRSAYASILLSGGYEEAGDAGRCFAESGEVLIHFPFDAHLDRFRAAGAEVVNLELPDWEPCGPAFGRVSDPDAVARLAATDAVAAARLLLATMTPVAASLRDWPDLLARDLIAEPGLRLSVWAERHSMAPETVSRGFRRVFGVSPAKFRSERRSRLALNRIERGAASFAALAAELGFSDQSHMTRCVGALTGRSPREWRRAGSNKFKNAAR